MPCVHHIPVSLVNLKSITDTLTFIDFFLQKITLVSLVLAGQQIVVWGGWIGEVSMVGSFRRVRREGLPCPVILLLLMSSWKPSLLSEVCVAYRRRTKWPWDKGKINFVFKDRCFAQNSENKIFIKKKNVLYLKDIFFKRSLLSNVFPQNFCSYLSKQSETDSSPFKNHSHNLAWTTSDW